MTADLVELRPVGDRADDTIRRTIDALVKGKHLSPDEVAAAAGMSRSTYFARMAGKGSAQAFKGGEIAAIAKFLGVKVSQIYDGLGGTFVPPAPPDGSDGLPRLDSNQQPSVLTSLQVSDLLATAA